MQYGRFAEVYDRFMDDVDYALWARYLLLIAGEARRGHGLAPVGEAFECGCGTGSLSLELQKAGIKMTCSDVSDEMLAVASEKARHTGRFIPFVRMDMRQLALHRPAECIIAACDCVNYLSADTDASAFFKRAYANLKGGGLLLFDISSEYKLSQVLADNSFSDSREDMAYFWCNNYDPSSKLIEMDLEFFVRSEKDAELYRRFSERHIQRAFSESELVTLLNKEGFEVSVFGAFTRKPPEENAERLQFVCVKPVNK